MQEGPAAVDPAVADGASPPAEAVVIPVRKKKDALVKETALVKENTIDKTAISYAERCNFHT